jgi:hypothetical protein
MKKTLHLCLALVCLAATSTAQPGTGGFKSGDLYLHQVIWSGISSVDGAVVRIDPLSGATTMLHDLVTSGPGNQMIAYDPWRDRLLFFGGFVNNSIELWASDAAGNLQSLGMQTGSGGSRGLLTSRGDGIVYLQNPANLSAISYLDAADQLHVVQNIAGTGGWSFGAPGIQKQSVLYVPKTNSLLITRWSFSDPCPGIPANVTAVHRLDLTPDGTQVVAESCFWFDANPADWDGETRGLSIGPNGDPILVIGNGGSGSGNQQRIATIDMATNTVSGFATTNFFAQHRIVGGTYSRVLGKALVHDSFADSLRAFAFGEVGGGTLFAPGLSASASSGEKAALIEIASGSFLTGLSAGTGSVSLSAGGTQVLTIDVGPAYAGAWYLALGSASGWMPGLVVDGQLLPLNFDGYFNYLLGHPNTVPLLGSLGLLDAQGRATVTFQMPAGSSPSLAGLVLHHAAAVLSPTLTVQRTTNAVPVELVP